jgi:hypothetical protein
MRLLRGRWNAAVVCTALSAILYGMYRLYNNFENRSYDLESPQAQVRFSSFLRVLCLKNLLRICLFLSVKFGRVFCWKHISAFSHNGQCTCSEELVLRWLSNAVIISVLLWQCYLNHIWKAALVYFVIMLHTK